MEQLDIDFQAPVNDGYDAWQWDRKEAVRQIAKAWALPIGAQVRLRQHGIDGDFEGKLEIATFPKRLNARQPLELKIGKMTFLSTHIETCIVSKNA